MSPNLEETYMKSIGALSFFKCSIQTTIVIRLCRKKFLWKFISQLECFIVEIVTPTDLESKKMEDRLLRKSYWFLGKIIFVIVFYGGSFVVCSLFWSDNVIYKSLAQPYLPTLAKIILSILSMVSWLLPIGLCIALGNALINTFKAFYQYLSFIQQTSINQRICCKTFVKHIRKSYITLTRLCEDFDDMFSLMLMFSYLIDLVLVCLELLILLTYTDVVSRLIICLMMLLPVVSLLLLSATTSRLYEAVRAANI